MSVCRDADGRWCYAKRISLPDGRVVRIEGSAPKTSNTKSADLKAEREDVLRLGNAAMVAAMVAAVPAGNSGEVPTFKAFSSEFQRVAKSNNKPSEVASKEMILRVHLIPAFGRIVLDQIDERKIERYKATNLTPGTLAYNTPSRRSSARHGLMALSAH